MKAGACWLQANLLVANTAISNSLLPLTSGFFTCRRSTVNLSPLPIVKNSWAFSSVENNDLSIGTATTPSERPFDGTSHGSPILLALDNFLSVRAQLNEKKASSLEICARGSTKCPDHRRIHVEAYTTRRESATGECVVTVVADGRQVDVSKLEATMETSPIFMVPDEKTFEFCGFLPGTIPPLGHYTQKKVTIVIDQDLLLDCQSNDLRLLGSGGHAYWQCLLDPDVMISLPNVQVASIVSDSEMGREGSRGTFVSSPGVSIDSSSQPIPLLETTPPPMNIASLVVQQRDLSNPLAPILVTLKGRIGKMERKGKRSTNCEFLPSLEDEDTSTTEAADNTSGKDQLLWKASNGETMAVRLGFGKPLIQKLGTTQGESAIGGLHEGKIIQVEARTNVGSRDALAKWVDDRIIELTVIDFQIFTSNGTMDESGTNLSGSEPYKHKPKTSIAVPILPSLTLGDVLNKPATIEIVDSLLSLDGFRSDFEMLDFNMKMSGTGMVGVDCEWQPNQLTSPGDPRPVIWLQLSFHDLGKVYLLDLQSMCRPMLHKKEATNEIEAKASETLTKLLSSDHILKVGYQLASDLRRIASSYPHMACFHEVHSFIEVDNLVKKLLHITKQKKSRSITMSLAKMTSHYMGRTVDKSCQISDWAERPLTESQQKYAAIDAAVAPALVEKALQSVNATINSSVPRIERWEGDEGLVKVIGCVHFSLMDVDNPKLTKKLQAKQIVGDYWIATQTWIAGQEPPTVYEEQKA